MGGPGSGGYKNAPGDTETHDAWDVIEQDAESAQKLPQVRCKYCAHEMAQHTSRQRAHLVTCQEYLNAMREQGIETSITRQAADPAAFFRDSPGLKTAKYKSSGKYAGKPNFTSHTHAVRIQAVALAEASIAAERIQEITGIDEKTLIALRKLARERGYDPAVSMLMKEEYVVDPPNMHRPRGRPRKERPAAGDIDPAITGPRAPPGYMAVDNLPPGNWNFMAPASQHPF